SRELQAREQSRSTEAVSEEIRGEAEQLVSTLSVEERGDAVRGRMLEQRALEDVTGADERQFEAAEILERERVRATRMGLDLDTREPERLGKKVDSMRLVEARLPGEDG